MTTEMTQGETPAQEQMAQENYMVTWQLPVTAGNPLEAVDIAAKVFMKPGADKFTVNNGQASFNVDVSLLRGLGLIQQPATSTVSEKEPDENQETEEILG